MIDGWMDKMDKICKEGKEKQGTRVDFKAALEREREERERKKERKIK